MSNSVDYIKNQLPSASVTTAGVSALVGGSFLKNNLARKIVGALGAATAIGGAIKSLSDADKYQDEQGHSRDSFKRAVVAKTGLILEPVIASRLANRAKRESSFLDKMDAADGALMSAESDLIERAVKYSRPVTTTISTSSDGDTRYDTSRASFGSKWIDNAADREINKINIARESLSGIRDNTLRKIKLEQKDFRKGRKND